MNVSMDVGYSNSRKCKYFKELSVGSGDTSDIVIIPVCDRIDVEIEELVIAKFTMYPIPRGMKLKDIDFTTATWFDWDGSSTISKNASACKFVNNEAIETTTLIRCS